MTLSSGCRQIGAIDPIAVATAWQDAVADACPVSIDRGAVVPRFQAMARDVVAAVAAPTPTPDGPFRAGVELVEMHFTQPAAVGQTLAVLGRYLSACSCAACADRVGEVLGSVATGFATALRDRTRSEQERITASAFAARSAANAARWNSEARFEAVFAESVIGISVGDVDGVILQANRALCDILGYPESELIGCRFWDFAHPTDNPRTWDRVGELVSGEIDQLRTEKTYYRRDGTPVWTDLVLSLIRTPDRHPRYIVAMVQDVTERRDLQDRLTHQAEHDPLTGLANRALFFERLDAALAAPERVGVCFLDLDGFKIINDTLGHARGDELLVTVAGRLAAELPPPAHLVARMGGDEFVVLVEDVSDQAELHRIAERARDVVRRPVRFNGHEIAVSASIGVVQGGDGGPDGAALMKAADATMYWAKRNGRDCVAHFDAERHRADIDRSARAARMPEAMARGEFVVEYQPLIRLDDTTVVGVEALVRWDLPSGKRLGPAGFIDLAEHTGLIVPLGRWILRESCRQAAAWRAADPAVDVLMSVNLAARQLREPTLLDDVRQILADTGWPPRMLQLELTESALMDSAEQVLHTLRGLARLGVRIAIDDFGTGYSNLAYLRHLPIHTIKLAGTFLAGSSPMAPVPGAGSAGVAVREGDVDLEVVRFVVQFAHALGMEVIAESVETAAQFEGLRELGCDSGQGWYFAPSVPPERVPGLVQALPWPARPTGQAASPGRPKGRPGGRRAVSRGSASPARSPRGSRG